MLTNNGQIIALADMLSICNLAAVMVHDAFVRGEKARISRPFHLDPDCGVRYATVEDNVAWCQLQEKGLIVVDAETETALLSGLVRVALKSSGLI